MHIPKETHIPKEDFISKIHKLSHTSLLISAKSKQFRIDDCKRCLTTLTVLPKRHPKPILNIIYNVVRKRRPSLTNIFHKLTPYGPLTNLVHQPPLIQPYFTFITCLQRASFWIPNLHSHFPSKAALKSLTFLIPKPPKEMGEQTVAHLTKWNFGSSPMPPHKKFHWSFSIQLATTATIGNKDRK